MCTPSHAWVYQLSKSQIQASRKGGGQNLGFTLCANEIVKEDTYNLTYKVLHTVILHDSSQFTYQRFGSLQKYSYFIYGLKVDIYHACFVSYRKHKWLTLRRKIRWFLQAVSQTLSFLRFPFLRLSIIGSTVICSLTSRWWRGLIYYWTHLAPVHLAVNCFLGYSLHLR